MKSLEKMRSALKNEPYLQVHNLTDINDHRAALQIIDGLKSDYGNSKDVRLRERAICNSLLAVVVHAHYGSDLRAFVQAVSVMNHPNPQP
jgi:hypothetical protein